MTSTWWLTITVIFTHTLRMLTPISSGNLCLLRNHPLFSQEYTEYAREDSHVRLLKIVVALHREVTQFSRVFGG